MKPRREKEHLLTGRNNSNSSEFLIRNKEARRKSIWVLKAFSKCGRYEVNKQCRFGIQALGREDLSMYPRRGGKESRDIKLTSCTRIKTKRIINVDENVTLETFRKKYVKKNTLGPTAKWRLLRYNTPKAQAIKGKKKKGSWALSKLSHLLCKLPHQEVEKTSHRSRENFFKSHG